MRPAKRASIRGLVTLVSTLVVVLLPAAPAGAQCTGDTDDSGFVDIDDIVNVVLDLGTDGSANGGEPGEGVFVQNQPLIRASRTDADVFHYLHSVSPAFGGTTLYRYEVGVPGWTSIHDDDVPKVRVFERSRVNPDGLLLGFGL